MRGSENEGIPFDFSRRLQNDTGTGYANGRQNVHAITLLRLNNMLPPKQPGRKTSRKRSAAKRGSLNHATRQQPAPIRLASGAAR